MNRLGRSLMLAVVVSMLAVTSALAADDAAPSTDPGEQIKQGFIGVGHGIRDGAIKAWGAVKSAVNGNSTDKNAAQKKSSAAADQTQK
jgi:hypothetical protein